MAGPVRRSSVAPSALAPLLGCLLALAGAARATAQSAALTFVEIPFGPSLMGDGAAKSAAGLGDLNGDGRGDFVLGFPKADTAQGVDSGRALVISGLDRSVLFNLEGTGIHDGFGTAVAAAGDVDGDGVRDVLVGAPFSAGPHPGYARVFSGSDGSVLHTLVDSSSTSDEYFGALLTGDADFDADGHADFVVGSISGFSGAGLLRVYSGLSGAVLKDFDVYMLGHGFVGTMRDVDQDGHDELLFDRQRKFSSDVSLHSGANWELLQSFENESAGADVGDLTGDGVPELCLSSGNVLVGGTWEPWLQVPPSGLLCGVGDIDGDGLPDIGLGNQIVSLADGQLLAGAPKAGALVPVGDVDGDGRPDVLAPWGFPFAPSATSPAGLFANQLWHWTDLGLGLEGVLGMPLLVGAGQLLPGTGVSLELSNAFGNTRTALVIGLHAVSLPFKGGTLVPSPDLVQWPILTAGDGTWTVNAHWPAGVPPRTKVLFQVWTIDPLAPHGFAASNALLAETP